MNQIRVFWSLFFCARSASLAGILVRVSAQPVSYCSVAVCRLDDTTITGHFILPVADFASLLHKMVSFTLHPRW